MKDSGSSRGGAHQGHQQAAAVEEREDGEL